MAPAIGALADPEEETGPAFVEPPVAPHVASIRRFRWSAVRRTPSTPLRLGAGAEAVRCRTNAGAVHRCC